MGQIYEKMQRCFLKNADLEELAADPEWRVRYSAAVAIGETQDEKWIPALEKLFLIEEQRKLYNQPNVDTPESTRLSEKIGPLEDPFLHTDFTNEQKEAWKCRGRVKMAAADAIGKIGSCSPQLEAELIACIERKDEDYSVKAAAARALGNVRAAGALDVLRKAVEYDEWCAQTEAKKAIQKIEGK